MTGERILTVPNVTAVFAVIWGLFTLNPYADAFAKNPTLYAPMASIAPEWVWGGLFVAVGCGSVALGLSGRRAAEALTLAVAFSLFVTLYFIADPSSPAWALYAWLVVANYAFYQGQKWQQKGRP